MPRAAAPVRPDDPEAGTQSRIDPVASGRGPMPMAAALHPPTVAAPVSLAPTAGPIGEQATGVPNGCTSAQLRRFIKSRAYLPVHEIRRRFQIESEDDEVTAFAVDAGRVFVGLPLREGRILGELVRAGEVGYELQMDPAAPVVVGVYPMRPVTRQ